MRRERSAGLALLGLLAIGTTGCFASAGVGQGDLIFTSGSEGQMAYEMGRRDGTRMHPTRLSYLLPLTFPLALLAATQSGEWWTAPATVSVVSVGSALWAANQLNAGLPSAPDSMRVRYSLTSDEQWRRYRLGFQDAVYDGRQMSLNVSQRAVGVAVGYWIIYFALRASRR